MNDKLFWRQSGPSFTMRDGTVVDKPKVLIHLCVEPGCTLWGCLSVGADWIHGKPGDWYCWDHHPDHRAENSNLSPKPPVNPIVTDPPHDDLGDKPEASNEPPGADRPIADPV